MGEQMGRLLFMSSGFHLLVQGPQPSPVSQTGWVGRGRGHSAAWYLDPYLLGAPFLILFGGQICPLGKLWVH